MNVPTLPCLGYAPDAHALGAPRGTMRAAENVVCDLPGVVRARPSFEAVTNKGDGSVGNVTKLLAGNTGIGGDRILPTSISDFPLVFPFFVRLEKLPDGYTQICKIIGSETTPNAALIIDTTATPVTSAYTAGGGSNVTLMNLTTYEPRSMTMFRGEPILVSQDGSAWRIEQSGLEFVGNAEPPDFDEHETGFAEARRSLYYTSSTGVRRLGSTTDAETVEAGVDVASLISPRRGVFFAQTSDPTGAGWSVAWSWVVKRTDANGYIKRSPPSMRWVKREVSGTAPPTMPLLIADSFSGTHFLFGFAPGALVEGDEIEFYRTTFVNDVAGTPAARMFLDFVYTITAADIAAGTFPTGSNITIKDLRTDDQLGEELYTNPGREGALNAKYAPPLARCLENFAGCMWFGHTTSRHRMIVELLGSGQKNGTQARQRFMTADTIGVRTHSDAGVAITGDYTLNDDTILNVTDVTGVKVGDFITDGTNDATEAAGTQVPADTQVVSISGSGPYTVVMSKDALATAVGAGVRFYSRVSIDGVDFRAEQYTRLGPNGAGFDSYKAFGTSVLDEADARARQTALELAKAINAAASAGLVNVRAFADGAKIAIERTSLDASSFTFDSATPNAWTPATEDALTSTQEVRPNRVFYSMPGEPEAVPLVNSLVVGAENAPIQRLLTVGRALLVFKEDGLFRITGSAPRSWSVDKLDTMRLVRPEAAAVLGEVAYAWTNRGVVEVGESGSVRVISAGKIDTALFDIQGAILASDAFHGCRIVVSQRHQLVLVCAPGTSFFPGLTTTQTVFVYSPKTGAWSTWPRCYIRCAAPASDGAVWAAFNNALDEMPWETRKLVDDARGFDREWQIEGWTQTTGVTEIDVSEAQRREWVPAEGDWVAWEVDDVRVYRRVIGVEEDAGDYTLTLDDGAPAMTEGTTLWAFAGTPVALEWMPSSTGPAGGFSLGLWRELTLQIDGAAVELEEPTTARVTLGVRHDGAASVPTVTGTPLRSLVQARPYRFGWPRNAARRPVAAPRLSFSEIHWPWRLAGVNLVGEPGTERVRR